MSAQLPIASPADVRRAAAWPPRAADHAFAADAELVAPWPPGRITDDTRSGTEATTDAESPASIEEPAP